MRPSMRSFSRMLARVLDRLRRDADLVARADLADEVTLVCRAQDRAALRHDLRGRVPVEDAVVAPGPAAPRNRR